MIPTATTLPPSTDILLATGQRLPENNTTGLTVVIVLLIVLLVFLATVVVVVILVKKRRFKQAQLSEWYVLYRDNTLIIRPVTGS